MWLPRAKTKKREKSLVGKDLVFFKLLQLYSIVSMSMLYPGTNPGVVWVES
jgi:hypothetical protein